MDNTFSDISNMDDQVHKLYLLYFLVNFFFSLRFGILLLLKRRLDLALGILQTRPYIFFLMGNIIYGNKFTQCYFREGNGTSLQYSCLENPMDGGAWWAAVHEVTKSQTRLSYFTFIFHFHALEKEMATHSSVLAWRIPGTGKRGGLLSMGSHRVGHD